MASPLLDTAEGVMLPYSHFGFGHDAVVRGSQRPQMRVLCIGAHPDDLEFGCGATLHKHLRRLRDWQVTCLTLGRSLDRNIEVAHRRALAHLGVPAENVILHDLPTSHMTDHRQVAWEILDRLWRDFTPELVITHEADYHQDHELVYRESMRTYYNASVILYGIARSQTPAFEGGLYEVVDDADVAAKMQALDFYAALEISDGTRMTTYAKKPYFRHEAVVGKMAYDGISAVTSYAEVFRVVRLIRD